MNPGSLQSNEVVVALALALLVITAGCTTVLGSGDEDQEIWAHVAIPTMGNQGNNLLINRGKRHVRHPGTEIRRRKRWLGMVGLQFPRGTS